MAHLTWPAYCFSKAALNTATRILHEAEGAHARSIAGTKEEEDPIRGRVRQGERSVRIVAVCPGDVATGGFRVVVKLIHVPVAPSILSCKHAHARMHAHERTPGMCDVDPSEALSPQQAALDLVWVALHPQDCPGGNFYRARQRIEW